MYKPNRYDLFAFINMYNANDRDDLFDQMIEYAYATTKEKADGIKEPSLKQRLKDIISKFDK